MDWALLSLSGLIINYPNSKQSTIWEGETISLIYRKLPASSISGKFKQILTVIRWKKNYSKYYHLHHHQQLECKLEK